MSEPWFKCKICGQTFALEMLANLCPHIPIPRYKRTPLVEARIRQSGLTPHRYQISLEQEDMISDAITVEHFPLASDKIQ